jgi:hypothetical protein
LQKVHPDLFIILNSSTTKPKNNKNYKNTFGLPSEDYKHSNEPKTHHLPRPGLPQWSQRKIVVVELIAVHIWEIAILRFERTNAQEYQSLPMKRSIDQKK